MSNCNISTVSTCFWFADKCSVLVYLWFQHVSTLKIHTVLLPKHSLHHQMRIHPQLKIIPNKRTVSSCLRETWNYISVFKDLRLQCWEMDKHLVVDWWPVASDLQNQKIDGYSKQHSHSATWRLRQQRNTITSPLNTYRTPFNDREQRGSFTTTTSWDVWCAWRVWN